MDADGYFSQNMKCGMGLEEPQKHVQTWRERNWERDIDEGGKSTSRLSVNKIIMLIINLDCIVGHGMEHSKYKTHKNNLYLIRPHIEECRILCCVVGVT